MRWRYQAVFAIVAALLVITAVPGTVSAQSEQLVVGSQHNDDTEFSNAKELDEVIVTGSGNDAKVSLGNVQTTRGEDTGSDGGVSQRQGLKINPNRDLEGVRLDLSSETSGATKAYLTDTSGNVLNSTTISDRSATIKEPLSSGTAYYLTVDAEGDGYDRGSNTSAAFPYTGKDIDITAGVYSGSSENTGTAYAVNNISASGSPSGTGVYVSQNHTVDAASHAAVNLTLENAEATVTVSDAGTGKVLNQSTLTSTANHTLLLGEQDTSDIETNVTFDAQSGDTTAELHDESILFTDHAPEVDNGSASPSGGAKLNSSETTLSVDVSDAEFGTAQGEELTVDFVLDGSTIDTQTVTSNGTVSTTTTVSEGGEHQWHVEVSDSYGLSTTSDTFTFKTPSTLSVRNESAPDTLVDNATIDVRFFGSDTIVTRETTNGTIDLAGLPVDEKLIVTADGDDYYRRHIILESIYQQNSIYLLNNSIGAEEVRFVIDDNTGNFPQESSEIIVEKPINRNNSTTYRVVAADEHGVNGFLTTLESEQRYLIKVRNDQGDTRTLGAYTASVSETVTLTPVALGINVNEADTYVWNGTYENDAVSFEYGDPDNETSEITVKIHEQGNQSNTLFEKTFTEGYGTLSLTEPVPDEKNETTWVVDWSAKRNGETIGGKAIVGPRVQDPLSDALDGWVQEAIAILFIILTLALFSQINRGTGAVTASMIGGGFWMFGWLPAEAGGAIVIALGVAVLYKTAGGR